LAHLHAIPSRVAGRDTSGSTGSIASSTIFDHFPGLGRTLAPELLD
jgi:hypothetical protein